MFMVQDRIRQVIVYPLAANVKNLLSNGYTCRPYVSKMGPLLFFE